MLMASEMHIIDANSMDSLENVTSLEESELYEEGTVQPFKARRYDADSMERKHSRMRQRQADKEIESGSRLLKNAQNRKEQQLKDKQKSIDTARQSVDSASNNPKWKRQPFGGSYDKFSTLNNVTT